MASVHLTISPTGRERDLETCFADHRESAAASTKSPPATTGSSSSTRAPRNAYSRENRTDSESCSRWRSAARTSVGSAGIVDHPVEKLTSRLGDLIPGSRASGDHHHLAEGQCTSHEEKPGGDRGGQEERHEETASKRAEVGASKHG
jgi:hypothetical protein